MEMNKIYPSGASSDPRPARPEPDLAPHQLDELRRVFNLFDRDHNGGISRIEFAEALKTVEFHGPETLDEHVDEIMKECDADSNGVVDFNEFVYAASHLKSASGIPIDEFPFIVRSVAKWFVGKRDNQTLSYLAQYKFWPPPMFMIIITCIQIGVFIYYLKKTCTSGLECPISWSSIFAFRPACKQEAWRFYTYIFLHAGWQHILFNMIIQLVMGLPLEMVHGPFRVLAVYTLGSIAGSLSSSVMDPITNLVGASGADYSLIGAHIADMIINWKEMEYNWVKALFFTILISTDFGLALYDRYRVKTAQNVSYAAHLAGFIVGVTLGTYFLRNLKVEWWAKFLKWTGVAIFVTGVIVAIFINIFVKHTYLVPYLCT